MSCRSLLFFSSVISRFSEPDSFLCAAVDDCFFSLSLIFSFLAVFSDHDLCPKWQQKAGHICHFPYINLRIDHDEI